MSPLAYIWKKPFKHYINHYFWIKIYRTFIVSRAFHWNYYISPWPKLMMCICRLWAKYMLFFWQPLFGKTCTKCKSLWYMSSVFTFLFQLDWCVKGNRAPGLLRIRWSCVHKKGKRLRDFYFILKKKYPTSRLRGRDHRKDYIARLRYSQVFFYIILYYWTQK